MKGLLRADFRRMSRSRSFWLCAAFMVLLALVFMLMQKTTMDYTVAVDRVIFLPMSFYGVAIAALVSLFIGEDYSDGVIRNKLVAGRSRRSVYLSGVITACAASLAIYLLTAAATIGLGFLWFERNVSAERLLRYLALGMFTCAAYACIDAMLAWLIPNRTNAVIVCMGLAFAMLFLCLHTNQVMTQPEYKNGAPNPHYVTGALRAIYAVLHDLNPSGQAAQLSAMSCFSPVRWILLDIVWAAATCGLGIARFTRMNIR